MYTFKNQITCKVDKWQYDVILLRFIKKNSNEYAYFKYTKERKKYVTIILNR